MMIVKPAESREDRCFSRTSNGPLTPLFGVYPNLRAWARDGSARAAAPQVRARRSAGTLLSRLVRATLAAGRLWPSSCGSVKAACGRPGAAAAQP